ncbi:MAG: hypothetical protein NXI31_11480 [bacterium]|nr:hypothetical protein [bacterium]
MGAKGTTKKPSKKAAKKAGVRGKTSDVTVEVPAGGFMGEKANEDRKATKASHIDDGLKALKDQNARMTSGIAYAMKVGDYDVKMTVMNEIADTAAAIRDDARRAVRNAKAENKNLQP